MDRMSETLEGVPGPAGHQLQSRRDLRRIVLAAGIGNYLEYFEWGLYGFFATVIGAQFFPNEDPAVQLLSVLAVFAVGFVFRPIGGLVLGPLGDRLGRKVALASSLVIMGVATTLIGLLPGYAAIGVWAPILLLALRCMQGFSTGGEFTSSMSLLLESVPLERRGRYGSLQPIVGALALITASLLALTLTATLTPDDLASWGWRIPFVSAALLTVFGIWLRVRLEESPVFSALKSRDEVAKQPIRRVLRRNLKPILVVMFIAGVQATGYYYLATYAVNYLTVTIGIDRHTALLTNTAVLAVYAFMCWIVGRLLDVVGRRPMQLAGVLGFVFLSLPAFMLIATGNLALIAVGLLVIATCQATVVVSHVLIIIEMFPSDSRATGAAAGENLGIVLLAGPGPYVASWIVIATGHPVTAGIYLCVVAVIGFVVMYKAMPETRGRDLMSTSDAMEESAAMTK